MRNQLSDPTEHTDHGETAWQLGELFRQWRIILGLSQQIAAERANISTPTLRRIERGETGIHLGSFLALANVLGLTERLLEASNPLETDLGRARVHMIWRQRAKRR